MERHRAVTPAATAGHPCLTPVGPVSQSHVGLSRPVGRPSRAQTDRRGPESEGPWAAPDCQRQPGLEACVGQHRAAARPTRSHQGAGPVGVRGTLGEPDGPESLRQAAGCCNVVN